MKDIEEITAYRTRDGRLFSSKDVALIHAQMLYQRVENERRILNLMVRDQIRCKREMKNRRSKDASIMQSAIDTRSARITATIDFIKRGGV